MLPIAYSTTIIFEFAIIGKPNCRITSQYVMQCCRMKKLLLNKDNIQNVAQCLITGNSKYGAT